MNLMHWAKQWISQKRFGLVDYVGFAVLFMAMFLLARLYFRVNPDDVDWEAFKSAHACTLQTEMDEQHRSRWHCNDGETYYRWRQQR